MFAQLEEKMLAIIKMELLFFLPGYIIVLSVLFTIKNIDQQIKIQHKTLYYYYCYYLFYGQLFFNQLF